jgi:hypothetical protein
MGAGWPLRSSPPLDSGRFSQSRHQQVNRRQQGRKPVAATECVNWKRITQGSRGDTDAISGQRQGLDGIPDGIGPSAGPRPCTKTTGYAPDWSIDLTRSPLRDSSGWRWCPRSASRPPLHRWGLTSRSSNSCGPSHFTSRAIRRVLCSTGSSLRSVIDSSNDIFNFPGPFNPHYLACAWSRITCGRGQLKDVEQSIRTK